MITVRCCVCGEDVLITIDELIAMEDDEIFCNDCATAGFIFCTEDRIIPN